MDNTENSPYSDSYGLSYDNGDVSLERVPYTHTSSDNDCIHTVMDGETLQNLAYQYYGDSGLWDIIADANGVINPLTDVTPGLILIIPNGK